MLCRFSRGVFALRHLTIVGRLAIIVLLSSCRRSLVVKPQLPKLMLRVRFPSPAPKKRAPPLWRGSLFCGRRVAPRFVRKKAILFCNFENAQTRVRIREANIAANAANSRPDSQGEAAKMRTVTAFFLFLRQNNPCRFLTTFASHAILTME